MTKKPDEKVVQLVRRAGLLRPRDLDRHGIPRIYLSRLQRAGRLERVARGLYRLPDANVNEYHTLAQVAKRNPHGVACLMTALAFHGMTTQAPFEVWWAIDVKSRQPKFDDLPVRIIRFSGPSLVKGVVKHRIEGVTVRVTSPAKTVADCFKFRNKIGTDVAIEALRDCLRSRKATIDDLWRYAEVCRVANVMRPYLEAMV